MGFDGAVSAVARLRHRGGLTSSAAASTVVTAQRLRQLPVTREAWLDGSLCGGQVQAVVANVEDRTVAVFAEQEASLVPTLVPLSTHNTTRAMRFWRARAEVLLDNDEGRLPDRRMHLSRTLAGRWASTATSTPRAAAYWPPPLRPAATDDVDGEPPRSPARRRADALVDMARSFLERRRTVRARGTVRI